MSYTSAGRTFRIERSGEVWKIFEGGRCLGEAVSPSAAERFIDEITGAYRGF